MVTKLAQGINNPVVNSKVGQGDGVAIINTYFGNFITLALIAGGVITLFFLITGAVSWISSGGDKEKLAGAQKRITHAVIGLFLLFSVFAIIKVIEAIFGLDLLTIDLSPILLED